MTHGMHFESFRAIGGFVISGLSYIGILLANNIPEESPIPRWLVSGGSGLTLTAALIYAVYYLNKECRRLQDLREADREKMERQWREDHEKNRASQDKLADSVDALAKIISKQ